MVKGISQEKESPTESKYDKDYFKTHAKVYGAFTRKLIKIRKTMLDDFRENKFMFFLRVFALVFLFFKYY